MNVSDTEIVNSILMEDGMEPVDEPEEAEVIFINTCSIRENAEERVWNRLKEFKAMKRERQTRDMTVGVLGCMAERIREEIMEEWDDHMFEALARSPLKIINFGENVL